VGFPEVLGGEEETSGLNPDEATIAELLKDKGYATRAAYVIDKEGVVLTIGVVVAVLVGDEIGAQRRLELLCLLEANQILQLEAVEFTDGVTEV